MKSVVFKVLSIAATCAGILVSALEAQSAVMCLGFLMGELSSMN